MLITVAFSCTYQNSTTGSHQETFTIYPQKTEGDVLFEDSMVSYVRISSNPLISEIIDIGKIDSLCYILDANGVISIVSIFDGSITKQMNRKGRGVGEMINPKCLTTDSTYIYIFDYGTNEIMIYDKNIQYVDKLKLSISPSSIIKTDKGFLCYEEIIPTVYFTDNEGKVVFSQIMSKRAVNITTRQQIFKVGVNKDIYFKAEYSDTIFVWNGNSLIPQYIMDYDKTDAENKYTTLEMWQNGLPFSYSYFFTDKGLLLAFMHNKKIDYSFYNSDLRKCFAYKPSAKGKLPLIPKWQFGNIILGIVEENVFGNFLNMNEDVNKSCQLVLLKYSL